MKLVFLLPFQLLPFELLPFELCFMFDIGPVEFDSLLHESLNCVQSFLTWIHSWVY